MGVFVGTLQGCALINNSSRLGSIYRPGRKRKDRFVFTLNSPTVLTFPSRVEVYSGVSGYQSLVVLVRLGYIPGFFRVYTRVPPECIPDTWLQSTPRTTPMKRY